MAAERAGEAAESPLTRGEWIEMDMSSFNSAIDMVSPRMRGAD